MKNNEKNVKKSGAAALFEVKNVSTPLGQLNKTEIFCERKRMCEVNNNVARAIFDFAQYVFSILGERSLGPI